MFSRTRELVDINVTEKSNLQDLRCAEIPDTDLQYNFSHAAADIPGNLACGDLTFSSELTYTDIILAESTGSF